MGPRRHTQRPDAGRSPIALFGRGGDTVGNPHRAQISKCELFELILLLKLCNKFPVLRIRQFEFFELLSYSY